MRMAKLSEAASVPVPTIKYYLREGLLPAGRRTAANQADYGEAHIRRLRLVRALVEVGGLGMATVREVLAAMDDPRRSLHEVLGTAHWALAGRSTATGALPVGEEARADVDRFIDELGWTVGPEAPARAELARALATLRRLGWPVGAGVFERYAQAADRLGAWELDQLPSAACRPEAVERAVVGTVVFETALVALRRLAQEHHSARRFAEPDAGPPPDANG